MGWQWFLSWILQLIKDPLDTLTLKRNYLNDSRMNILVSQNEMLSLRIAVHSRLVYWYWDNLSISLQSTVSLFFPVQIILKRTWISREAWPCNLNTRADTKVQNYHHFMFCHDGALGKQFQLPALVSSRDKKLYHFTGDILKHSCISCKIPEATILKALNNAKVIFI